MTEEAQRIAIAQVCGYTSIHRGWPYGQMWGKHPGGDPAVPDYLHDLNAMAEAEKILDSHDMDTRSKWLDLLAVTCEWPKTRNAADLRFETHYLTARSTAAQRAEAFLKTLGLWKSS